MSQQSRNRINFIKWRHGLIRKQPELFERYYRRLENMTTDIDGAFATIDALARNGELADIARIKLHAEETMQRLRVRQKKAKLLERENAALGGVKHG